MIGVEIIEKWLSSQERANDSRYDPFLIGNDPNLSKSDIAEAARVSGSKDILMVGTGGLYSLLLLLRIWRNKNHEGHVKLVILDTSQAVFDQVWKPFQEGVSKLRDPIDLGDLLESIAEKLYRGVLVEHDYGKNYVNQDVDMFIGELFIALPGKKPQDKLVTLKKIVRDVDFARVSWAAKDLFKDLMLDDAQLILYPSNIEPFLANEELSNFKTSISMPGSIVISSDLVSGHPSKMSLSLNADEQTAAPITLEQAEAFFFSGGAKPIRANTTERMTDHQLTEAVSDSKVDNQKKIPQVDEAIFVQRFREHYKPGFFGGHWGRPFARPIMSESSIRAHAATCPASATAKAVEMVDLEMRIF